MLLPAKASDLLDRAKELKEQCFASHTERLRSYSIWRSYFFTGSRNPGEPSMLNLCGSHADRLHSALFSPVDARFMLEFGQRAHPAWHKREVPLSRHLTKEFNASNVDLRFGEAVLNSLPYGAAFVKLGVKTHLEHTAQADTSWIRSLWRRGRRQPVHSRGMLTDEQRQVFNAFDPYVILPHSMGVLREDVNGLDRQECVAQRTPITRFELARRLRYHPDAMDIMRRVAESTNARSDSDTQGFIQQVVIGGLQPLSPNQVSTGTSYVSNLAYAPSPQLDPKVLANMVWLCELWVVDDERGDYTTIQYVEESDILLEGGDMRRNLFVPGEMPYVLVQPNEQHGNFWGRSEFADLVNLQDSISTRLGEIKQIGALQADSPHAFMGFTGNIADMRRAARTPGGMLVSDMPTGKIEKLAPQLPEKAYENLLTLKQMFDEEAGFPAMMQGQGEAGVRAGSHAATLSRHASARVRDRALLVERQYSELGTLGFKVMQAKDPTLYGLGENDADAFLLADVPDDHGITVDSHSSSPAFTEDNKNLAFALARAGAYTPKMLLLATHAPMLDLALAELEQKQAAEQRLIAQHPELLTKGRKKR